jgi:hypothetical protein
MPVIPALRSLKQEDHEFKVSLGYIVRPYSRKKQKKEKKNIMRTILFLERSLISF